MGVWSTELKGSVELTNANPIVEETFIVYVPIGDLLKAKREGRMVYLTRSRFEGEVSLAEKYLRTSWEALRYLVYEYYPDRVFVGVGVPYNSAFMSFEELREIGERIASLDPSLQVCVLDYRPEFKARHLRWPSYEEMLAAKRVLEEAGCKVVIAQTRYGHVGPS